APRPGASVMGCGTSTCPAPTVETRVPFVDLGPAHAEIAADLLGDVADLLESGAFTNGPAVTEFEQAFARYCGVAHCVGLASGIEALRLGLLAAAVEPGDEVIVPANTFIATLEAVVHAGATPVLVDASEADLNLDVEAAESSVGPRTRFLLPVDLYGQLADIRAVRALAERHGLFVLEDAAQAHGAS